MSEREAEGAIPSPERIEYPCDIWKHAEPPHPRRHKLTRQDKIVLPFVLAAATIAILTGNQIAHWAGLAGVLYLIVRSARRDQAKTETLRLERDIYRDRLARGLTVAEYWRDGVMQEERSELEVPYRTMAHPLACAISALTGEEHEPSQMGITGLEFTRRFPKTLEQLDERVRIEREGLPAEPAEPCWTGTVDGALCHRGGIGCPRPHAEDPDELRRAEPRRLLAYDPLHPER